MFSRTKLMSALGIAALALVACSSPSQAPASAPSPEVTSTSASPTPSSTSVSPTPSVQVTSETPAPEPTSATPSPEPTTAAPADQTVAAPGTNCGPAFQNGQPTEGSVYVSGGKVSCAEAIAVMTEYLPQIKDIVVYSRDAVVEGIMGGYQCNIDRGYMGGSFMLSGQQALCRNNVNGAYIELRSPGERILPGYVVDIRKHIDWLDSSHSTLAVQFSTPAQTVDCIGTIESEEITCRAFLAGGGINYVTMGKTGAPRFSDFSDGPTAPVVSTSVDVGTVITALGVSCKPTDAQTLYCVNTTHGFTLSPRGFVQD